MNGEPEPAQADEHLADTGLSGLADDLRLLVGEARSWAEAEADYQKVRARFAAGSAARVAIYGLIALIVAIFALGALVIGLLLALATLLGPWWATAIVAGGLSCVALVFGLAAKARFTRSLRLILGNGEDGNGRR